MSLRIIILALFFMVPFAAYAQDSDIGLYAPKPPPGSAFVRFFNPTANSIPADIGGKDYGAVAPMSASPYFVQPKGDVGFKVGGQVLPYELVEGKFYTVAMDSNANALIHEDAMITDPEKALVVLYNLGHKGPLTLKAKDGMIAVIENAPPGKSGYRGINPVKVDFSVFDEQGKKLQSLAPVILERGHVYSIFYAGGKAVLVKGETDTSR